MKQTIKNKLIVATKNQTNQDERVRTTQYNK